MAINSGPERIPRDLYIPYILFRLLSAVPWFLIVYSSILGNKYPETGSEWHVLIVNILLFMIPFYPAVLSRNTVANAIMFVAAIPMFPYIYLSAPSTNIASGDIKASAAFATLYVMAGGIVGIVLLSYAAIKRLNTKVPGKDV